DGHGGSSGSTLTITVTGTNDPPKAVADTNTVTEDTQPNQVTGNVLTKDTDADQGDQQSLVVTAVNGSDTAGGAAICGTYGALHLNADGSYSYTLDNGKAAVQALGAGQAANDVFDYTVSDGHGGSTSTTLTIAVNGTNDPPVAVPDTNTVAEDTDSPATGDV